MFFCFHVSFVWSTRCLWCNSLDSSQNNTLDKIVYLISCWLFFILFRLQRHGTAFLVHWKKIETMENWLTYLCHVVVDLWSFIYLFFIFTWNGFICCFNCTGPVLDATSTKIKTSPIIPIRWWKMWNQIMLFYGESIIRFSFGFLSSWTLVQSRTMAKGLFFSNSKIKMYINKVSFEPNLRCTPWVMNTI